MSNREIEDNYLTDQLQHAKSEINQLKKEVAYLKKDREFMATIVNAYKTEKLEMMDKIKKLESK